MKTRKRWHQFLCWILGHNWDYYEKDIEGSFNPDLWQVCKRCAKAEWFGPKPPDHPICRSVIND